MREVDSSNDFFFFFVQLECNVTTSGNRYIINQLLGIYYYIGLIALFQRLLNTYHVVATLRDHCLLY